ncbi:MAG: FAD-binding protein [Xenococcaceae cyanobacterium MO_167.B27]|nr:FAD-binding protein [Xenococcaceae cyanobacterium MO_167.B27]
MANTTQEQDIGNILNREIISALVEVLGEQYVQSNDISRQHHSQVTIPLQTLCSAVVSPQSITEIQQVLQIAAQYKLQVWPFGRGNNWGYGTKNGLESGAIIMILERMNRILEVNAELAYAIIEPGVTQKQLNDYLKENNIPLWADCTDSTPYGSVLGNAIERGYGYTPHGDHFGNLCGLEVVLPNGDVIKTGDTLSNSKTWNTFKWGLGPYIEGLFSQSNLGIVVKAGIWLMPQPESWNLFTFDLTNDSDLPQFVDRLRPLMLEGIVQSHVHMVNDFQMLSVVSKYPYEELNGKSCLSDETLTTLRKQYGVAPWSLVGGIYGSKEQVKLSKSKLKKSLSDLGKIEFFDSKKVNTVRKFVELYRKTAPDSLLFKVIKGAKALLSSKDIEVMALLPEMHGILQGNPTERIIKSAYFKSPNVPPEDKVNPAQDNCGVIWLAPAVPASGKKIKELLEIVRPLYDKSGFDFSGCLTRINNRTFFLLLGIFFQREDEAESQQALELYNALAQATKQAGYQPYRGSIPYWSQHNNCDNALSNLLSGIKQTVDPENILAPGKYGIRNRG